MSEKLIKGLTRSSPWGAEAVDALTDHSLEEIEGLIGDLGEFSDKKQEVFMRRLVVLVREVRREKRTPQE
jgi:hypothetical protein